MPDQTQLAHPDSEDEARSFAEFKQTAARHVEIVGEVKAELTALAGCETADTLLKFLRSVWEGRRREAIELTTTFLRDAADGEYTDKVILANLIMVQQWLIDVRSTTEKLIELQALDDKLSS